MTRPLDGIRVCDLTRILAGPFATMKLADMGADVVKVERPGSGDDTRTWGPPFVGGQSAYFLSVNRNKRSLALDLKADEGKEVLARLVAQSDVVISNFRPGTMEKLGFGPDRVAHLNERAIYCTISGYGDTPDQRGRSSYDVIVQGESGVMDLTGSPDGPPTKVGLSIADEVAGMLAVEGILLSLFARERTGRGDRIDVALLDGMLSLLTYQSQNEFAGSPPRRRGNEHPSIVPYQTFRTADGWINVGVGSEALWAAFCAATGRADLAADPRYATNRERVVHRDALIPDLETMFAGRPTDAWLEPLAAAGIPTGRILDVARAVALPTVARRGTVLDIDHPTAGRYRTIGNPLRLASIDEQRADPPPLLGADSDDVLTGLGYSTEAIDTLRSSGVLGDRP